MKQPKTETARQRTSRSLKIPSSLYIHPRESRNHLCLCNFKTINYEMISKPFLCIVIQLKTEILSRLLKNISLSTTTEPYIKRRRNNNTLQLHNKKNYEKT